MARRLRIVTAPHFITHSSVYSWAWITTTVAWWGASSHTERGARRINGPGTAAVTQSLGRSVSGSDSLFNALRVLVNEVGFCLCYTNDKRSV